MKQTKAMIYISLFACMSALFSQVTLVLPMTPVPINLGVVGAYFAGYLLGPKKGVLSQLVYLMLGAIGLPVFAGFTGGVAILVGPTGGFLFGYIAIAFVVGYLSMKKTSMIWLPFILLAGLLTCYMMGTIWLMLVLQVSLLKALMLSVLPFILIDVLKILIVTPILYRLQKLVVLR